MQIVRHLGLMITRQQWSLMKKKDRNVVDKLIHFSTQLENDYPIKGGSTIQSIKEFFLGYSKVSSLVWESWTSMIRASSTGRLAACMHLPRNQKKTWVVLSPSDDLSECTHIVHKPSGIGKQLALCPGKPTATQRHPAFASIAWPSQQLCLESLQTQHGPQALTTLAG
jgi:hypothetical protein